MAVQKGIIVFRGTRGSPQSNKVKCSIFGPTDATALGTLAATLATHSKCNAASRSFVDQADIDTSIPASPANTDIKGVVYFRDPDTLRTHSITIPDPVDADVDETQDEGDRLTDTAVSAIVTAINTATGKSYTPLYGVHLKPRG